VHLLHVQSWLKVTTQFRVQSLYSVVFFAVSTMSELAGRGQDPD